MHSYSITFLFLLVVGTSLASPFTDCGSDGATVTKVDVSGCSDSSSVCQLKRGTKAQLSIQFQSQSTTKTLKAVVHGVISGVPLPFSIPNENACQGCGVACPLKSGSSYTYSNMLNIENIYPTLSVNVKWELQDDSGSDVVCVMIPAQIV